METQFRINGDIPGWLSLVVLTIVVAAIARLVAISYARKASIAFIATGAIGYILLSMAALRPETRNPLIAILVSEQVWPQSFQPRQREADDYE